MNWKDLANLGGYCIRRIWLIWEDIEILNWKDLANLGGYCVKRIWLIWEDSLSKARNQITDCPIFFHLLNDLYFKALNIRLALGKPLNVTKVLPHLRFNMKTTFQACFWWNEITSVSEWSWIDKKMYFLINVHWWETAKGKLFWNCSFAKETANGKEF